MRAKQNSTEQIQFQMPANLNENNGQKMKQEPNCAQNLLRAFMYKLGTNTSMCTSSFKCISLVSEQR